MSFRTTDSALYIGLMSGTSLDGVDACLVAFDNHADDNGDGYPRVVHGLTTPFPAQLADTLRSMCSAPAINVQTLARAERTLTGIYADAVKTLLKATGVNATDISAIGCHGQTLRHYPDIGFSWQIGNPSRLAALSGIPVVADFRSADLALGGQGAPLAPAFHHAFFASPDAPRMAVNIGGIANISELPVNAPVRGWDTGPGNTLMDAWFQRHHDRGVWDENGAWAATGKIDHKLLASLLEDDYFPAAPPKSTGPEHFNLAWLERAMGKTIPPPADVQATLMALTVETIAMAVDSAAARVLIVCGGGAFNKQLMKMLAQRLPDIDVSISDNHGVPADLVESAGFAWLARQRILEKPGNLPSVTGASKAVVLGGIWEC